MKILKKAQLKIFGLLTALVLVCALSFIGNAYVPQVSADTDPNGIPETVEYINTNVETIAYRQDPSCVFFGFKLTESDYGDYGLHEGDFGGNPAYETYERYIRFWLTYWENFPSMNSEAARLDQLYAYWNGSSVGEAKFAEMLTHRSTLKLLEYGFVISIPAGTTFPSLKYVKGNCEGNPIIYRTTEDRAFYFNGTAFVSLPYQVAEVRAAATQTLNNTDVYSYYGEKDTVGRNERAQVKALVEGAKKEIGLSFTVFAVEEVLARFENDLAGIMSKADYATLASSKTQAKSELAAYFTAFEQNNKGNYAEAEWNSILVIKGEYSELIDSLATIDEVEGAILGVKFAVENVMTKAEKAGFADYIAAAVSRLENAFTPSIYRTEEREQGELLVSQGSEAIAAANSYAEVDAIMIDYIARIDALKTDAEWTAEEETGKNEDNNQGNNTPPTNNPTDGETTPDSNKAGCGGFTGTAGIVFATAAAGMAMIIKKKKEGIER